MDVVDIDAAEGMIPLVDRGRAAYGAFLDGLPTPAPRVGWEAMEVVTADDFGAFASLCLRHVTRNRRSLHILCKDGSLCAQLLHLTWRRP